MRAVSWLLQGERDGDADEAEGLALFAGGLGEYRDGRGGAGEADLVAGQGSEVGEQAAEAAVGPSVLVVLAGGLGLGGSRAASGGEGVCLGGRVLAGVGQRRPCKTGRRSRSPALMWRKSRSAYLRFLYAVTTPGALSWLAGTGVRST